MKVVVLVKMQLNESNSGWANISTFSIQNGVNKMFYCYFQPFFRLEKVKRKWD
jgi:hypothetical protein